MDNAGDPSHDGPVDSKNVGFPGDVCAVVEEHDDERQCTLYPCKTDEATLTTSWMTAAEGSFVSLDEMR